MQPGPKSKIAVKLISMILLALISGVIGAALAGNFGTSSISISYIDFISVVLTALGVMLATATLFVAVLAVIGWTSIEARLRNHSIEFIGSELKDDKPLAIMIKKAVREAVYEGVAPTTEEDDTGNADDPADEQVQ